MSASVQRRALEEELRLVLEQKATIEAQLAALRSGGRPAALKALKRNSSVIPAKTHVPATKKQKVRHEAVHCKMQLMRPAAVVCTHITVAMLMQIPSWCD